MEVARSSEMLVLLNWIAAFINDYSSQRNTPTDQKQIRDHAGAGVQIFSKCVPWNFAYPNGRDIYLFRVVKLSLCLTTHHAQET
jgi:hypothetical protein